MTRISIFLVIVAAFHLSACQMYAFPQPSPRLDEKQILTKAAATSFGMLTKVAGVPTDTPIPTQTSTPLPPSQTPTLIPLITPAPMDALGLENTTVYSSPASDGVSYGNDLIQGLKIKVLARDISGQWLLLKFADSPSGVGWVQSSAIKLNGDIGRLVIGIPAGGDQLVFIAPLIWTIPGVPLPLPTLSNDPGLRPAVVIQPANVRVCPNQSCMMIGALNVGNEIIMTGRYHENKWAQFIYPSGPGGRGWVSRDAIKPSGNGFSGLPYFDELGRLITPEPPTATFDPNMSPTPSNTAPPTPPGPLAEITDVTMIYALQNSLSPELGTLNAKDRIYIIAQSYNHLWFEIQYPFNSTGRGYISTKAVHVLGNLANVPFTDANGTPYPTP